MIDQGWITIHRKIKDSAIYRDSQAVHLWIHLLLSANHKENKMLIGNKVIEIKRGQILTGRKSLSSATGINEHKIDRLLKTFEKCDQIKQQTFSKYRVVSIVNYDSHQSNEQQVSNSSAASEQQVSTNNNVNNSTKDQNTSKSKNKFSDEEMGLAIFIYEKIKNLMPNMKKPNLESWANHVRLMVEVDLRGWSEIKDVFTWANNDPFWQSNILSPSKLRKQFDQLSLKSKEGNNNETSGQRQNTGFDQRSRAQKVSDKLDEIARRDIEQNGFTADLD